MKVTIQVNLEEIEKEFGGSGTKEDPIIIDSTEILPQKFRIFESKQHLIMKNCNLDAIAIHYSKNITIENCIFNVLELYHNSKIIINDTTCSRSLLSQCTNCHIIGNRFTQEFAIFMSHNNTLKNNKFENIFKNPSLESRGNILENNKILDKYKKDLIDIDVPHIDEDNLFLLEGRQPPFVSVPWLIECKGKGNKNDPIIIGSQEEYFPEVYLDNNRHYLMFNNFNPTNIRFFNCRNVTINNCNFKECEFFYCRNINSNNSVIKEFKLNRCKDILIENSNINRLKADKENEGRIIFKNCTITRINKNLVNLFDFKSTNIEQIIEEKSIKDFIIIHRDLFILLIFLSLLALLVILMFWLATIFGVRFITFSPLIIVSSAVPLCLIFASRERKKRRKERNEWQEKIKNIDE